MCGIAGEVRFDGKAPSIECVREMSAAIAHRGPDDEGMWCDEHVAIAHRRLAIRDLSEAGRQPMVTGDGMVVVSFNGEIYNDVDLRRELERNHRVSLKSSCDAELLPVAFSIWGESLFSKLEGMFAIAIWDKQNRHLYLARDGIGIKPLFFQHKNNVVTFASELKSLLVRRRSTVSVNPLALHSYLAQGYVGPDQTLLEDIKQIKPGNWIKFGVDSFVEQCFWQPSRTGDISNLEDAHEEFDRLFSQVCQDMMVADVPVGVLQSSGIDSSLISLTLSNPSIALFTAKFANASFDESGMAGQVARQIGSPWHVVECDSGRHLAEDFINVVRHLDGQVADSSALAFFQLSRKVSEQVKVALSGDGADEFFAGYNTYCVSQIAACLGSIKLKRFFTLTARKILAYSNGTDKRYPALVLAGRFFQGVGEKERAHAEWRRYMMPWVAKQLYSNSMLSLLEVDPLAAYKNHLVGESCLDRCLVADQSFYLPSDMLMKVDAMSMAHGLEIRVPFLDRRIMEFSGRLSHKLLGSLCIGRNKRFLRQALSRRSAPKSILNRKKAGFNVPVSALLNKELSEMCEKLFIKFPDVYSPLLRPDSVRKLWMQHKNMKTDHGYVLWALLVMGVWLKSI